MGVMLLMVIIYAEILVIRDHLWVIEGSMRESRRWRDIFFNQTTLRRQRIRKFLSIFLLCAYFPICISRQSAHKPVLSFMGIMLLMTVLYYEILTIRDEIFVIGQSLQSESDEEAAKRKSITINLSNRQITTQLLRQGRLQTKTQKCRADHCIFLLKNVMKMPGMLIFAFALRLLCCLCCFFDRFAQSAELRLLSLLSVRAISVCWISQFCASV
jgi:hypothetical protein